MHVLSDSLLREVSMAELTTKQRNDLPDSAFALPGRRYPIQDESHARNALARVSQHGTPEEKRKVRAAVQRKFPNIEQQRDMLKEVVRSRGKK